ncbi:MAG: prephenate dehydrogenase [Desulfomonilia bacterium]
MKITIIGLGLIGASLAKSLQGKARITGVDRNPESVRLAISDGIVHSGGDNPALSEGSDMIVISVPVCSIVDTVRTVIPHIREETIITDTGSTKAHIVQEMDSIWPNFVGSHPIAGREHPGYAASDADLFRDAYTIMTPGPSPRDHAIQQVKWLWHSCGATTIEMNPDQHDELMARISHMPHLLSFASMCMAQDLTFHKKLLGAGFRDFTRIAASDPIMWRDILLDNRDHVLPLLDRYMQELKTLRKRIEAGLDSDLARMLEGYAQIRRSLYEGDR